MAKEEEVRKSAEDLLKGPERSIIYIGNDKGYWGTIESRLDKSSEELKFRFVHLTFMMNLTVEQMFLRILRENPAIIYIDFSTDQDKMLKLAKYLHAETITARIPRIALIDERSLINMTRFAGVNFTHFKGGEYHDVVYDPLEVSFSDKIQQPEFATAQFSLESHLIDDMTVVYYTAIGARIEGNVKLAIGQVVEIENNIPKERIPSKKYFIKKTGAHDIVSDAKYFYEIEYTYADEPVFNNDELERAKEIKSKSQRIQTIKLIKSDRQEQLDRYNDRIAKAKEDQKNWVIDNSDENSNTITKILVVDMSMSVFEDDSVNTVEDKPFSVRCQSDFTEIMKEVFHSRPAIVAFQLVDEAHVDKLIINMGEVDCNKDPRALTEGENELKAEVMDVELEKKQEQMQNLIRRIKEIPNYKPFIILFNCGQFDSKTLQKEHSYPLIMSNKDKLNFRTIINMAEIYHKKTEEKEELELKRKAEILMKTGKMKDVDTADLKEQRVFPEDGDSLCFMSYGVPITIKTMTETEIVFETEASLDLLQSFRLEHPLSMSLTIVKNKNGDVVEVVNGFNQYRALINTVDEIDKKYIRQYVNEIIFSPVKEERNKEQSAFKELNEKFAKLKKEQMREREEQEEKQKK